MCGCNTTPPPVQIPQSLLSSSGNFTMESIQEAIDTNDKTMMVTVEYIGDRQEPFSIRSRVSGDVVYRFAANSLHSVRAVFLGDAAFLIAQQDSEGKPTYRVVSNIARIDTNDPSAFVGAPITA